MKPNLHFDNHIKASIRRDASSDAEAQATYKNWLETHPEQNIIDDTNEISQDEEITQINSL